MPKIRPDELATVSRRGYLGVQIILRDVTGGGLNGPPFLLSRSDRPHLTGLEARLAEIVTPTLEHMGYELVRVAVSGEVTARGRPTVQVMVDRADESPIGVGDCEAISRALGAVLDVADPLPGAWMLEVSSAGIDRPLTRVKDWNRFSGHLARVELAVPMNGRKRLSGMVLGADAAGDPPLARLRLEDGTTVTLPLPEIRRAKLVLTEALIEATATPRGTTDRSH
jgi:ribosome maturation factor RimP